MKHTTWNESPTYVRSVNKRDQILEKLLLKSRARQSDELRLFISEVLRIVTRFYPLLNKGFWARFEAWLRYQLTSDQFEVSNSSYLALSRSVLLQPVSGDYERQAKHI